MGKTSDMVVLGRLVGLFGIKGWLKVHSDTEPRENILSYSPWYLEQDGEWRAWRLAEAQRHGKGIIARLEGCMDRDAAAQLVGRQIAVTREQLPATGAGEYYWRDLEGLQVINEQGVELGTVSHLLETGSNDVLVVQETEAATPRERLIPYIPGQVIKQVDLVAGRLTVDWDPDF